MSATRSAAFIRSASACRRVLLAVLHSRSASSRRGLHHRESAAQTLAKVADGGARSRLLTAPRQPKAFPWGEHEVSIILLGDSLQTVPRGVGDHERLPF